VKGKGKLSHSGSLNWPAILATYVEYGTIWSATHAPIEDEDTWFYHIINNACDRGKLLRFVTDNHTLRRHATGNGIRSIHGGSQGSGGNPSKVDKTLGNHYYSAVYLSRLGGCDEVDLNQHWQVHNCGVWWCWLHYWAAYWYS
jgi:hypothetical protein